VVFLKAWSSGLSNSRLHHPWLVLTGTLTILVLERLGTVSLPSGTPLELAAPAKAYGEIYRYELQNDGRLRRKVRLNDRDDMPVGAVVARIQGSAAGGPIRSLDTMC
jgi:hypothetical protein